MDVDVSLFVIVGRRMKTVNYRVRARKRVHVCECVLYESEIHLKYCHTLSIWCGIIRLAQ